MSYYGSEFDQELSRIVAYFESEIRWAFASGCALGFSVGVLVSWWLL